MPRDSHRKKLLDTLRSTHNDLVLARYLEIIQYAVELLDDSDESESSSGRSSIDSNISMRTVSSASASSIASLPSLTSETTIFSTAYSDISLSSDGPQLCDRVFTEFIDAIGALRDEVEKCRVLDVRPRLSRASQLHLLPEWANLSPERFRRKLRVDPQVFDKLIERIQDHPIFQNNSNNSQLPVAVQLALFLNGVGHYGNAATTEDVADWAGVSVGTVYNCYKRVMIAILQHHDDAIHFDPLDTEDQEERRRAKQWVEQRTCREWRGGFLCVDGTPFNLFQKPGWHGEGFFDKKSNYSLTAQVCSFLPIDFDTFTPIKRSLFCPIISALSTTLLVYLGAFMMLMCSGTRESPGSLVIFLAQQSGYGRTQRMLHRPGVLHHSSGHQGEA